jgi:hypothetical protein
MNACCNAKSGKELRTGYMVEYKAFDDDTSCRIEKKVQENSVEKIVDLIEDDSHSRTWRESEQ